MRNAGSGERGACIAGKVDDSQTNKGTKTFNFLVPWDLLSRKQSTQIDHALTDTSCTPLTPPVHSTFRKSLLQTNHELEGEHSGEDRAAEDSNARQVPPYILVKFFHRDIARAHQASRNLFRFRFNFHVTNRFRHIRSASSNSGSRHLGFSSLPFFSHLF